MSDRARKLMAADVLQRYKDEDLPEYFGRPLDDVNQVGNFGNYPISTAAVRGALDELKALLDAGADVNAVGEHGHTPLLEAVGQGHAEAVQLLLDYGARTTEKNDWGLTPLDLARMYGRKDLVKLLEGTSPTRDNGR